MKRTDPAYPYWGPNEDASYPGKDLRTDEAGRIFASMAGSALWSESSWEELAIEAVRGADALLDRLGYEPMEGK